MAIAWSQILVFARDCLDTSLDAIEKLPGGEYLVQKLRGEYGDKVVIGTLAGASVLLLVLRYQSRKKYKNLPPGPRGLPYLGNVFQLDQDKPHETITQWSEKYGDVFQMSAFGRTTVILNSFDTIYEGLVTQSQQFAGRVPSVRMNALMHNGRDIETQDISPQWAFRKKLSQQTLKGYGENMPNLEVITMELINDLMEEMKHANGPIDMYPLYHKCIAGIITSIIFGEKVDEKVVDTILDNVEDAMKLVQPTGLDIMVDLLPWLRFFPNKGFKKLTQVGKDLYDALNAKIVERKVEFDPENPMCFTDGMLQYQKKSQETGAEFQLDDMEIYGVSLNLIIAATYTMSVTLNALIAVIVNKPELQEKMVKQIKAELGDRPPCLSDRKVLQFIEAAILETFRYSSVIALNSAHRTTVDTKINGYDIPEDTEVLYNLWKLHHNPKHWDEPWEFKPERYLDKDGKLVPPTHDSRKMVFAFGSSRRVCIGESLAKNRLFLMVTSLLQRFEFKPAGPDEIPRHDPRDYKPSFGVEPHRYRVRLVPRK